MYQRVDERSEGTAGFAVATDVGRRILRLECKGVWKLPLAEQYRAAMREAFERLRGKPWIVVADIRAFAAQSPEVGQVHAELMGEAAAAGMVRACSIVASALTRMQIKRLAEESHMPEIAFFSDEEKGTAWALGALKPG